MVPPSFLAHSQCYLLAAYYVSFQLHPSFVCQVCFSSRECFRSYSYLSCSSYSLSCDIYHSYQTYLLLFAIFLYIFHNFVVYYFLSEPVVEPIALSLVVAFYQSYQWPYSLDEGPHAKHEENSPFGYPFMVVREFIRTSPIRSSFIITIHIQYINNLYRGVGLHSYDTAPLTMRVLSDGLLVFV